MDLQVIEIHRTIGVDGSVFCVGRVQWKAVVLEKVICAIEIHWVWITASQNCWEQRFDLRSEDLVTADRNVAHTKSTVHQYLTSVADESSRGE